MDVSYYLLEKSIDSTFFEHTEAHYLASNSFEDYDIDYDAEYFYRVSYVVDGQMSHYSNVLSVTLESMQNVEELIITSFSLNQNYPNPFNPTTEIGYSIPEDTFVSITIYDVQGRSVKSLVNQNQDAGIYLTSWNAKDEQGNSVPAGMYFCTIRAGDFTQTKKMILLK